jgi:dTMP kinase
LIAIEGLDKAGKSTQCQRLIHTLTGQGYSVMHLRFPGRLPNIIFTSLNSYILTLADRTTPIGQMIDSYLRNGAQMEDHAIHLLFSANRWEAA